MAQIPRRGCGASISVPEATAAGDLTSQYDDLCPGCQAHEVGAIETEGR